MWQPFMAPPGRRSCLQSSASLGKQKYCLLVNGTYLISRWGDSVKVKIRPVERGGWIYIWTHSENKKAVKRRNHWCLEQLLVELLALVLLQSGEQLLDVEVECNLHASSCILESLLILQMDFWAHFKSLSGKESIWQHYHLLWLGLWLAFCLRGNFSKIFFMERDINSGENVKSELMS